jgi:hypothetical protein
MQKDLVNFEALIEEALAHYLKNKEQIKRFKLESTMPHSDLTCKAMILSLFKNQF